MTQFGRYLLLVTCALTAVTASASGAEKIKTKADQVTVFVDGAQVTRSKEVTVPGGTSTLTFTGMSPYMDVKSLQVRAKGSLTILAINTLRIRADSLEQSAKKAQLEKEIKQVAAQTKQVNAARQTVQAETDMVTANCSLASKNNTSTVATIKELNQYYSTKLGELSKQKLNLEDQLKELTERNEKLQYELGQLGGKRSKFVSEVEVKVNAATSCKGIFTLTYYVLNASWIPSYDVRANGLKQPIEISYKANIIQNTGEDWQNVALTLSSSNPKTDNLAPRLNSYVLGQRNNTPSYEPTINNSVRGMVVDQEGLPVLGATVMVPGSTIGTITNVNGRYSLTIPREAKYIQVSFIGMKEEVVPISGPIVNVMLEDDYQEISAVVVTGYGSGYTGSSSSRSKEASPSRGKVDRDKFTFPDTPVMEVKKKETSLGYEYEILKPYTIPSDGKVITAEIGRYEIPTDYVYQITPKIDKDAFLTAKATDWEKYNFLEGEANVYFENTFIGKSILSPRQTRDTLHFSLGRDRSILVEREKVSDPASRQNVGSNREQSVTWKIDLRNTRLTPVQITLYDQIPVSNYSNVSVTADELSGGHLSEQSGLVTWDLELQPNEQRELRLKYTVKQPKNSSITVE